MRDYVELDRAATVEGSPWQPLRRWGDPLLVTDRVSSSETEGFSHSGPTFGADVTTLLGEYE